MPKTGLKRKRLEKAKTKLKTSVKGVKKEKKKKDGIR
jgi:hypothetical protein